jgi:hypothetical protein
MTSAATLSGLTCTRVALQLPAWGVWWADVEVDRPAALSGAATLVMGGQSYVGTVMSGGAFSGRSRFRVAGGAGGWGKSVVGRHYANDAGIRIAQIVGDAAGLAGETVEDVPAGTVGTQWTREDGPAARTLEALYPSQWYVGEDGITRIGARASVAYSGAATRIGIDAAAGRVELASDDLAGLVPGVIVEGVEAVDVHHELDGGKLRTTVWGAGRSDTSRRLAAMRRLFEALTVSMRLRGVWEYRVVLQSGERLELQPVRRSLGLPDLRRVKARLAPGIKAEWAPGSLCLVSFVAGDPSRPVVVAGDDPESPGWLPDEATIETSGDLLLGASPRLGVARTTDAVLCGGFGGTITGGSGTVKAGA